LAYCYGLGLAGAYWAISCPYLVPFYFVRRCCSAPAIPWARTWPHETLVTLAPSEA